MSGAGERMLIALDIDGTVLLEDETLSPGAAAAISHAQAAGHEVMVATGRSWEGTHHILDMLGIAPDFAVCSNGAVTMRRRAGADAKVPTYVRYERAHVETFDPGAVLALLREHLPDANYLVELADGARLYTREFDEWNLDAATKVDFDGLSAQEVCRVVVVSPEGTDGDFLDLVSRIGLHEVSYAVGWSAWLDIAPQGVDKSTALERVREALAVEEGAVLVIGDGRNDLEMFRWARRAGGRAVAMGQGPDEVRAEASDVTSSVYDGGVAAVLGAL